MPIFSRPLSLSLGFMLAIFVAGCSGGDGGETLPDAPSNNKGVTCEPCAPDQMKLVDSTTYCGYRCVADLDAGEEPSPHCPVCQEDEERVTRNATPCGYVCMEVIERDAGATDVDPDAQAIEVCNNLVDDDQDGDTDCADSDCTGVGSCPDMAEVCDNTVDDDGDDLIDCLDPSCADDPACPKPEAHTIRLEGSAGELTAPYPGADIDAVMLHTDAAESPFGLSTATATYNDTETTNDTTADGMLGLADADPQCDLNAPTSFYSLGGETSLVVGTFGADVAIHNGDEIEVVEVGLTECGEGFTDESWTLSVSNEVDDTWIEVANRVGSATVVVDGLTL